MTSGHALGSKHKTEDDDIRVLGEDDPGVLTYSLSSIISLYSYHSKKYSKLKIPYKTIKPCKIIREAGIREVVYEVFHRPDKAPHLRSLLDLWGFDSYHNYLYTICELGFLEGLVPVVDLGFLIPSEIELLHSVTAIFKSPLFTDYDLLMANDSIRSLERSFEIKSKVLSWIVKLNCPVSTGFFVHQGMDLSEVNRYLDVIQSIADSSEIVHEIVIYHRFRSQELQYKPISDKKLLKFYELTRSRIPDHIPVIISEPTLPILDNLMEIGLSDLGSFSQDFLLDVNNTGYLESVDELAKKHNYTLQQRFPLRKEFITSQRYSKKLGQVFDAYKYKVKKAMQEKQRENKL